MSLITYEMLKEATEMEYPKCIKALTHILRVCYKFVDTDLISPMRVEKPVSCKLVEQFESDFDITLPSIYKCFLTKVSDGYTSSLFSLYKVSDLSSYNKHLVPSAEEDEQIDNLLHEMAKDSSFRAALMGNEGERNEEKFAVLEDIIKDDTDVQPDTKVEVQDELIDGIVLIIGEYKRGYDIAIVCGGSHDGEVVLLDWDRNRPHLQNVTFDVWLKSALLTELDELDDMYREVPKARKQHHIRAEHIALVGIFAILVGLLYKFLRKNRD